MPRQIHHNSYNGSGVHHNMWDSRPTEMTSEEAVKIAEELWPTEPRKAASAYRRALFLRYQGEHFPSYWARAGAFEQAKNRKVYFEHARADAAETQAAPEVMREIDLLETWADRNEAGEQLPSAPDFVHQGLLAAQVGRLSLIEQKPAKLAA